MCRSLHLTYLHLSLSRPTPFLPAQIWGIHCTRCPLKTTIEHINYLLKEYFSSGDKDEAERCLKELGVPHFHHEVVYELILLTLQDGHTAQIPRMAVALMTFLSNTGDISEDQMATVRCRAIVVGAATL